MLNIRQVPLCYASPVRIVDTLLRDREDALLGEEELLDWPFRGSMAAVGGISFECCAIVGGNAALCGCELIQQ